MKAYKALGEEKQEISEIIMKICEIGEETGDLFMFINALLNVLGRTCVDFDMSKDKFLEACEMIYNLQKDYRVE